VRRPFGNLPRSHLLRESQVLAARNRDADLIPARAAQRKIHRRAQRRLSSLPYLAVSLILDEFGLKNCMAALDRGRGAKTFLAGEFYASSTGGSPARLFRDSAKGKSK
jgi:hypothetical protein